MHDDDPKKSSSSVKKRTLREILLTLIKVTLTFLVVYFVGKELIGNWSAVITYRWKINYMLLAASLLVHLITFALFAKIWCLLMQGFGYQVPFRHGFKIAYIANLGRYIPGRIWPMFGMVYIAKKINISEEAAVTSWAIALLFAIPPSFLVASVALLIHPEMISTQLSLHLGVGLYGLMLVTLLLSLVLILAPRLTLFCVNILVRFLKRPAIRLSLSVRLALSVYFGYMLCWICYGIAFWLFVNSVAIRPGIPLISCAGAFVLAYQIGYFAVFTPGGLGARELVLIGVLSPYLGPAAAGIAVLARVWNTACDILASLLALRVKI